MAGKHLLIYYNDLSDSDNWAVARFLLDAAARDPSVEVVWIVEPRQVALGYPPVDQTARNGIVEVLTRCFPELVLEGDNRAIQKLVVTGELQEEQISPFRRELDDDEFDLLQLAVSPKQYAPREDADLHGSLGAADFLSALHSWSPGASHDVFVNGDALDRIINPVNLKTHSHEELVCRTPDEINKFNKIMKQDFKSRRQDLLAWYEDCRRWKMQTARGTVQPFKFDQLIERVKAAKTVKYFGGASLLLLQRFLDSGIAEKINCCIQAGAIDPDMSLFKNQFNLLLCMDAAKAVLPKYASFASFKMVPSDASNLVEYYFHDLTTAIGAGDVSDPTLTKQILTFNIRQHDALTISKGIIGLGETQIGKMPDFTAFLCGFQSEFAGSRFEGYEVRIDDEALTFHKSEDGTGLPVAIIDTQVTLSKDEISSVLSKLSLG